MLGSEIDHTHGTIATGHAHIHLDTVGTSLVDRHQVVDPVDGVIHHLGRYQLILAQELQLVALHHRRVFRQVGIESS